MSDHTIMVIWVMIYVYSLFSHVQLFVTFMDCSPPGSSVLGILQARILEWVAISSAGDLPDPGTESLSSALTGGFFNASNLGSLCNIVV